MASRWSEVPLDIVGSILGRLPFVDHVRFSSVCVSWRSAVRSNDFRAAPEPPWLMIPRHCEYIDFKYVESWKDTFSFLRISDNKVYNIPQPDSCPYMKFAVGSSMGWLITADERLELHLWNPITGSQINLPPFKTLPHVETIYRQGVGYYLYMRAIFVPSSQSSSDFTVVLIYEPQGRLAFAKAGSDSWTALQEQNHEFLDVIHHKGDFYTLDFDGNVEAWDLSGPLPKSTFRAPKFEGEVDVDAGYLVESSSGDLLQVHRSFDLYVYDNDFEVFRMDLIENKWVPAKGLGNEALFLGCGDSTSLSSIPELRGNHIYFSGEARDAGIFNLEDRNFQSFSYKDDVICRSWQPIWITPSRF